MKNLTIILAAILALAGCHADEPMALPHDATVPDANASASDVFDVSDVSDVSDAGPNAPVDASRMDAHVSTDSNTQD